MSDQFKTNEILDEFPSVSRTEWMEKITAELRGKSISELDTLIDRQLKLSPFAHQEEVSNDLVIGERMIKWQNGVEFSGKEINSEIHTSLNGGCENIMLSRSTATANLASHLQGVHLGMIGLHISAMNGKMSEGANVLDSLANLCEAQKLNGSSLCGSIRMPFSAKNEPSIQEIKTHHQQVKAHLSNYSTVELSFGRMDDNAPNWIEEDAQLISKFLKAIDQIENNALQKEILASTILVVEQGSNVVREMVRLQSLRVVWQNVLKASGNTKEDFRSLEVSIKPVEDDLSKEGFMIHSSVAVLAAASGGADRIVVRPGAQKDNEENPNQTKHDEALKDRIALNVHHLLKYESLLETYPNPMRGSFFFEKAVRKASELLWDELKK